MFRMLLFVLALPAAAVAQVSPGATRATPLSRAPLAQPPASDGTLRMNPTVLDDMTGPSVQLREAMPSSVTLAWDPLPGVSGFLVFRNDLGQVTPNPLPPATTSFPHAADNDYRLTYQYRVVGVYPNGHYGPSAWVPFQPPRPLNPTDFTATPHGSTVTLTWRPVAGVEAYLLGGRGLPLEGVRLPAGSTTYEVSGLPVGRHEWVIGSYYPLGVSTPGAEWKRAAATVVEASGPPPGSTSGRYRITLAGFVVDQEAPEDILRADGRHNEAFAAAMVQVFDTTGAMLDTATVRSAVHGDASNFPTRVPAGRASDTGGLMTGDTVPVDWRPAQARDPGSPGRFPILLWEGTLNNGVEVVALRPQVWEDDGDNSDYNFWKRETRPLWRFGSVRSAAAGSQIQVVQGQGISMADAGGSSGKIGATGNGRKERLVVLTRTQIEANLTKGSNSGTPRGVLPIRFVDAGTFNVDDPRNGEYTLYLRVERIP